PTVTACAVPSERNTSTAMAATRRGSRIGGGYRRDVDERLTEHGSVGSRWALRPVDPRRPPAGAGTKQAPCAAALPASRATRGIKRQSLGSGQDSPAPVEQRSGTVALLLPRLWAA